jgi:hypothetical protein
MKVDSKMKDISESYYFPRMHSMLRDFDKVIAKVKHIFMERYGQESAGRDSVAIRSRMGYLPQDPRFYEYMTAR